MVHIPSRHVSSIRLVSDKGERERVDRAGKIFEGSPANRGMLKVPWTLIAIKGFPKASARS